MITWTEIMETCDEIEGDYRQRLVAYFKSIEGQETDRKDGAGQVVKVTGKTFAEARGISYRTFARWVEKDGTNAEIATVASKQKTREIEQWHVRTAARKNPESIVEAIAELPEQHQAAIINRVVERFPKKPRPAPTSRPDALGVLDVITECRKAVSALSSAAGAVGMTDWDEETREAIHEIVAQMENYVSAIRSLVDGFDPEELLK